MPVLLTRRRRGSKIFGGAILIAVARVYVIQREGGARTFPTHRSVAAFSAPVSAICFIFLALG